MPLFVAAILLGLIQGLGEFLPISSSGHLIIAQDVFGLTDPEVAFDVVLHLGTLSAVCLFYRDSLISLVKELRFLPGALISPAQMKQLYGSRPDFRFGLMVLIGSLPTGVIGLVFKDVIKTWLTNPLTVGLALLLTGVLLRLVGTRGRVGRDGGQMTVRDALLIGAVQGLAIVPGFSRSGFTICAALFAGLNRATAARYSFILSIPAILGATVLELGHGLENSHFAVTDFALGFVAAGLSGFMALSLLIKLLKQDNFTIFSWWCWLVGLFAIGWHFYS